MLSGSKIPGGNYCFSDPLHFSLSCIFSLAILGIIILTNTMAIINSNGVQFYIVAELITGFPAFAGMTENGNQRSCTRLSGFIPERICNIPFWPACTAQGGTEKDMGMSEQSEFGHVPFQTSGARQPEGPGQPGALFLLTSFIAELSS
jgi:hypothetical protein